MGQAAKPGFHIPSLDGIRAVSVLIVFLSHAGLSRVVPGTFGVTVFFFLSGYLITTLLRLEYEEHGRIRLAQFYLRRALRILPPLYVVLAAAVIFAAVGVLPGGWPDVHGVLAQGFFLGNYYEIADDARLIPGTDVLWSLAVEEHFYLVFPLLFVFLCRRVGGADRQGLVLALTCLTVLAWRCVLVFGLGYGTPPDTPAWRRTCHATDTRLDAILWGCALALYGNPALDATRWPASWWKWVFFPASLVGLVLVFAVRDDRFRETFRYTVQSLLLVPVFVTVVRYPNWGPCRLLNLRPVRFLGLLSYTLYLLHYLVIVAVRQWLSGDSLEEKVVAYGFAAIVSVLLSIAIYYTVELPFGRLRKRLSRVAAPPVR
jgi:peptidoglycan/LPS O-acetylase OafA/YrhL